MNRPFILYFIAMDRLSRNNSPLTMMFGLLLLLCVGCSDDSDKSSATDVVPKGYYSYQDLTDQLVGDDTLIMNLTDTFSYRIDIDTFQISYFLLDGFDHFKFDQLDDYSWKLIAVQAGNFDLSVFLWGDNMPVSYNGVTLHTCVPALVYRMVTIDGPELSLNVADENLKAEITAELQRNYTPVFQPLKLYCDTLTGGTYSCVPTPGDTVTGTFLLDRLVSPTTLSLTYNSVFLQYTITQKEAGETDEYLFKQDLTETFRDAYPDESIDEVSVTFTGFLWSN
jgi:hypothetical protein